MRGEDEERRYLSDFFVCVEGLKRHMQWYVERIIVALSARINLNLFFRYLTLLCLASHSSRSLLSKA